ASAVARPIPLVAPVTMTDFSRNDMRESVTVQGTGPVPVPLQNPSPLQHSPASQIPLTLEFSRRNRRQWRQAFCHGASRISCALTLLQTSRSRERPSCLRRGQIWIFSPVSEQRI